MLRGGFRPPSSYGRACAPTRGRDLPASSLPNCDNRLVRIHGCSTSLTQEPAPPIKQIGRDAMAASGGRYRLAWFETLLNDCQLLLGCPSPAANITRQQFNVSIRVRHKPVLKSVLEPFCLCRLSVRNGEQFTLARSNHGHMWRSGISGALGNGPSSAILHSPTCTFADDGSVTVGAAMCARLTVLGCIFIHRSAAWRSPLLDRLAFRLL